MTIDLRTTILFLVTVLFIPKIVMAQLLMTSNYYRLANREANDLYSPSESSFLGYFPTLFEPIKSPSRSGVVENWFSQTETRSYVLGAFHAAGFYQAPYREPLIANDSWPVLSSDLMTQREGLMSQQDVEGFNTWGSVESTLRAHENIAIKGKFSGGQNYRSGAGWYQIDEFYSDLQWNRLLLSVGRKPLFWGQNANGSFLQSLNARNLDLIEISAVPVMLPSFLRYLGWVKADVFVSRLDDERIPGNDFFTGWRLGIKPHSRFELNMAAIYQWGGKGIDSGSLDQAVVEYLGGRIQTGATNLDTSNFFNRAASLDWRLSFYDWKWPTSFYSEMHLEDCCGNPLFVLKKSVSYSYGVLLRTHAGPDAYRVRVEYLKTANALYYHQTWPSAASNGGRLFGHPMGRDAQEIYFEMGHEFVEWGMDLRSYGFWRERLRTGLLSIVSEIPDLDTHQMIEGYTQSEKTMALGVQTKWGLQRGIYLDLGLFGDYVFNKAGRGGRDYFEGGIETAISFIF